MGSAEQHDKHVNELMRTRFPIHGDNWRKAARYLLPRWGKPEGEHDAPYGVFIPRRMWAPIGDDVHEHVTKPYLQLYVYDPAEPDRPTFLDIPADLEAARAYVRLLSEYIAYAESEDTN